MRRLADDMFLAVGCGPVPYGTSAGRQREVIATEKQEKPADVLAWAKLYCPHYFSRPFSQQHIWLGGTLTEAAVNRGQRIVVEGPRESAKSTIITFAFPLYAICEEKERYIILASETSDQAKKYLEALKHELEGNAALKKAYPLATGRGELWNKDAIITANGIRIEALGAGKSVRGRKSQQYRPTTVIIDDPDGDDAVYSSVSRERIRDWFTKGVSYVGSPETNYFVIGTRVHAECLTAHLSRQAGWKHKAFRAIQVWPTRMELWAEWESIYADAVNPKREQDALAYFKAREKEMLDGSEVLWPELEGLYSLMCRRASNGHSAFESEKQNNPIDPSKCEWPPELFEGDIYFDEWPKDCVIKTIGVDPSKGATDKPGDYSAIVKLGRVGPLLYVEADLKRRDVATIVQDVIEHARVFQPDAVGIESNMWQDLLVQEIFRVSATIGTPLPVVPLENTVKKVVRIRRLGPYLNMRAMRFKRRSAGTQLLLQQLQQFPLSDFDDGPDSLEMAVRMMGRFVGAQEQGRNASDTFAMPGVD